MTDLTGDTTLYARWNKKCFMTYKKYDETNNSLGDTTEKKEIAFDAGVYELTPHKINGYTQNGFKMSSDGDSLSPASISVTAFTALSSDYFRLSVYEYFTENTYIIHRTVSPPPGATCTSGDFPTDKEITLKWSDVYTGGYTDLPTLEVATGSGEGASPVTFSGWDLRDANGDYTFTSSAGGCNEQKTKYSWRCFSDAKGGPVIDLYMTDVWKVYYVVHFDSNGGSAVADKKSASPERYATTGEYVYSNPTNPTWKGYNFLGWSKTRLGNTLTDNRLPRSEFAWNDSMTYLELTRYAHWEKRCRLVYYDDATKQGSDENLHIPADETTGLYDTYNFVPNKTLTKAGYFFKGWSLENGSDTLVSSINSSAFTELNNDTFVMNVYAVWEPKTYTITWDLNDSDFEHDAAVLTKPNPLSVTLTQSQVDAMTENYPLGTASATGYKFLHWRTTYDNGSSTELNGSTTTNDKLTKSWFSSSRTGLFAAKAEWQAQYSAAFDANAGSGTVTDMPTHTNAFTGSNGDKYGSFKASAPSREGYTFMGWALDAAGTEMVTGKTGSIALYVRKTAFTNPIADPPSFETTLYAIWAKNITVTFDYNGGAQKNDSTVTTYQKTGNTVETIKIATSGSGDPQFERTGHTFVNKWNTQPDGSGTEYTAGENVVFSDDITLYAMWQATFRLSYISNATDVSGMPQFGSSEGTYRLSDVETGSILIKAGENNGPKKRGYVFKGWSLTADGTQMVQNGYEPLGSVPLKNNFTWDAANNYYAGTVYAIWEILEYQIQLESGLPDGVTFSGLPDDLPEDHTLTFTYEQIKDGYQAHDLTAAGYQFLGWNVPNKSTNSGLEPDVEGSDYITIDDDYIVGREQPVVLTAQWNKLYHVHYEPNLGAHGVLNPGNTPVDALEEKKRPADLTYEYTVYTLTRADNYKREDDTDGDGTVDQTYTFMGWSLSSDNDVSKKVTKIPDSTFTQDTVDSATNRHSLTLYAIWKANVILTYHGNGGYFSDNGGDTLIVDSKAIQTNGPSQWGIGTHWNGHTFLGWNTKADGTGQYYIDWSESNTDRVKNVGMLHTPNTGVWSTKDSSSATFTESTDLYAQWARDYRVVYHTGNPTLPYDQRYLIGTNTPDFSFPINYSAEMDPKKGIPDLPKPYTQTTANNTNYYFMGWTWDPAIGEVIDDVETDGNGNIITYLTLNDLDPAVAPADVHFKLENTSTNVWKYVGHVYGVWSPNPYKVRFTDGSRASEDDITRPRAGTVSGLPDNLAESDQGAPVWNSTTNTYDVTISYFEAVGGYSVTANMLSAKGYNFRRWSISYPKKSGGTGSGGYGSTSDFKVKLGLLKNSSDSSVTLTGDWQPVKHNVTYQQDDGGAIRTNYNVPYESSVTVGDGVTTQILKEGKTFIGWQLVYDETDPEADKDALGETIGHYYDFDPDDGSTPTYTFAMPDRDVTFRAVYAKDSYTVTYKAGEGSGDDKVFDGIGYKGKHPIWNNKEADGTTDHFTRTGYAFDGWTVEPTKYTKAPGYQITVKDDITYTAKWKVLSYPVSYYQENGTIKIGDKSYDYNTDATVGEGVTAPDVTGKTFDHWQLVTDDSGAFTKDAADGAIPNSGTFPMPAGTVKFKAVYRAQSFPVVYYEADGVTKITEENRAYGTTVTVGTKADSTGVTATVPEGYEFDKWELMAGGVTVSDGTFTMPAETVNFKAVLSKLYLLKYVSNGVTADNMPANQTHNLADVRLDKVRLSTDIPTADGYEFIGWQIENVSYTVSDLQNSDEAKRKVPGTLFDNTTHEATAAAQWNKLYRLHYDPNAGTGGPNDDDFALAKDTTANRGFASEQPERNGYVFEGWSLTRDGDTVSEISTAAFTTLGGESKRFEATVYAVWTEKQPVTYTLTTSVKPDSYTLPATEYYAPDETHIAVKDVPTEYDTEKYQFSGWTTDDVTVDSGTFTMPGRPVTFKGTFTLIPYKVSYAATDENGNPITLTDAVYDDKTYGKGAQVTVAALLPDKEGYAFVGWQYGSETYADGDVFTMPAVHVTLTGTYTVKQHHVLYYDQGGTAPLADRLYDYHEPVTVGADVAENPKRDGCTFAGWKLRSGSVTVTSGGFTMPDGDVAFEADYTKHYLLHYDANGGENPPTDEAFDLAWSETAAHELASQAPGREWHTFGGWSFDGNAPALSAVQLSAFSLSADKTRFEATVKAIWNENPKYPVTYQVTGTKPQGYSVPTDPDTYYEGQTFTVAKVPTVDGFDFSGWTNDGIQYADEPFTMVKNGVTFTGQFTEHVYTLRFMDGSTALGTQTTAYTAFTQNGGMVISQADPTKAGYTFKCWCLTDEDTTPAYEKGDKVPSSRFGTDRTVTLYAQWTPLARYTVSYRAYKSDDQEVSLDAETYAAKSYLPGETVTVAPKLANTSDSTFIGWVYNESLAYNGGQTFTMPAQNMQLVGRYIKNSELATCDITYKSGVAQGADGWTQALGSDHSFEAQQGTEHIIKNHDDEEIGYLRENYDFLGWNITFFVPSGGALPQVSNVPRVSGAGANDAMWEMHIKSFMVYCNVTLTAVWNATLTYDANGGTGTVPAPQTCRSGESVTVADGSGLSRDGYTFAGWNTESTAAVSKHAPGSSMVLYENTTLYAIWIKQDQTNPNYTLTYDANGGSGTVPTAKSYPAGTSVTVAGGDTLSRSNATFVCWNTDPNRKGTDYVPGTSIQMTQNHTLYAIWRTRSVGSKHYTLTYDGNGATSGAVPVDSTQYYGGETVTVAARGNLARTDCTFVEWNTKRDGTGTGYKDGVDILTMPKGNVTLYAVWHDADGNTVYESPHTGEGITGVWAALGAAALSALVGLSAVIVMKRRQNESVSCGDV